MAERAAERGLCGRRWRPVLYLAVVGVFVALGTRVVLRALERDAVEQAAMDIPPVDGPPLTAHVLGSIRRMKLVTVELASHANAQSAEESWRGDVKASVDAPVKLHYGTDLSKLKAESVEVGPLGNSWIITVPPPERVATEVFGERESTDVRVGWMRSRAVAGEKHLGLARRDLYESARRLRITPEQHERVRGQTREQVGALVRSILGPWTSVTVRFEDEVASTPGATETASAGERR